MKKILFFTLVSMFFLASCGQKEVAIETIDTSAVVEQGKQELVAEVMEKADEVMEKVEAPVADIIEEVEEVMEDKMEEEVMEAKTEEVAAPAVALAGNYATYDSSLVGSTEKTVLFFHAGWCPSCVSADKAIISGDVPDGLTILKTDFDNSTDLRQKYGVVSQHTFVQVDADGNMINKWTGGNSVDDIVGKL